MAEQTQTQFLALIAEINQGNEKNAREMVTQIMKNITGSDKAGTQYLSVMYRLISHLHKSKPDLAYHLYGGIIQSTAGPLFDHFAIELFDDFYNNAGWDILKNFSNILKAQVPSFTSEPIFIYILRRIISQLKTDELNNPSQLCYKLPHEKSFTWGWYVNFLAPALYFNSFEQKRYSEKTFRRCLMNYRKYITKLSSNVVMRDTKVKPVPWIPINTWTELLNCVEYNTRLDKIIAEPLALGEDPQTPRGAGPGQPLAAAQPLAVEAEPLAVEAEAQLLAVEAEADEAEAQLLADEAAAEPIVEKKGGLNWVYSLFGWN